MHTVLSQLNAVPGVIGSMACDMDGRLLGEAFPPLFDAGLLKDAARVLSDGAVGLALATDSLDLLDFRFGEARLSVKPFPGAMLLVLSSRATNLQFLNLAVSLAAGKLAKVRPASAPMSAPAVTGGAALPQDEEAADDDRRNKRVARPTKGLEELRRRLAEARGQGEARPGSNSITLPIASPEAGPRPGKKSGGAKTKA